MHFLDADCLAGEDRAEIDFLLAQTEASAMGDHDHLVVEGVVDGGQSLIRARGGLIDLGRALHVQRLVRPLAIKNFHEVVEASLLLQKVGSRRLGGFFLQGEMHALVTSVQLGMARLDAFDANAQAQPPDGELAEVEQGMCGSKGHAVVAADVGGQATLLKQPLKHGKSVVLAGGGQGFAAQQITAGMIGDRERIAVLTVAEPELAFVIGAPEFIGPLA